MFTAIAALGLLIFPPHVASSGEPKDLSRLGFTTGEIRETFIATRDGGIEDAVVTNPSVATVRHLRALSRKRAADFARGRFVDPTNPHGDLVPGLREMRHQWNRVHVHYQDLPAGSRIRYTTNDPTMVEALHQWFAARAAKKL